jgi:hypothetical protein
VADAAEQAPWLRSRLRLLPEAPGAAAQMFQELLHRCSQGLLFDVYRLLMSTGAAARVSTGAATSMSTGAAAQVCKARW